ncbi:enoyl-CoA hydratase/isomerase family protein [Dactylonectria estremocensis]|uniref:Enoyl-CoA hydratase/isomerase family protein n=1 Tax=Dactylonectria estremocensis TaxID=1079267 RepID=A0A9P9IS00_9HYPO|nr:enoyl-CoA hydratase/isomerase family protein [Dactylonectria estremocensis]
MDSGKEAVLTETTAEGITIISINRPHRRNAVDPATAQKLYDAILGFENDPKQKIGILTGVGGTFCAGADLHEVAQMADSSNGQSHLLPFDGHSIGPTGPSRMQIKKPFICAVAGYAVAGGLELSLLGDLRIVEEDAVLGVFCRRWGVPLIDGGTVRLQAIVGLGRALDMILTGRPVGAQEALGMGLATRVVPKGEALGEAIRLAKQLLAFPEYCMNLDRKSCYYSAYDATSFEDAMRQEYNSGVKAVEAESIKGAATFSKGAGRHGSFKLVGKLWKL